MRACVRACRHAQFGAPPKTRRQPGRRDGKAGKREPERWKEIVECCLALQRFRTIRTIKEGSAMHYVSAIVRVR